MTADRLDLTVCPKCERPNPPKLAKCWGCGAPLAPSVAPRPPTAGPAGSPATSRAPAGPYTAPVATTAAAGARPAFAGPAPPPAYPPPPYGMPPPPFGVPPPAGAPPPGAPLPSPAYGSAPPAYGTPLQYGPPVVPSHRRRNAAIALGAVAVLVAVIVVLSVALPHGGSGAANVFGTPVPYSAIVSPISTADSGVPGGPWTPVVVFGLGLPSSLTGSISNGGLGDDSCSPIWTGAETSATFPATVWGSEPGDVASWTVFSSNGDGDVLFSAASEISGTTVQADAYEVEAGSCLTDFSSFTAVTASPVDSTTAASAAGPNGGSSFLSANSGATIELLLTGDVWAIVYTTCGFDATSGTGSAFIGEVNATTGAWVDGGTMPEDC